MFIEFYPFPFGLSVLILAALLVWRRKRGARYLVRLGLFGLYLIIAAGLVLFPLLIPQDWPHNVAEQWSRFAPVSRINFVPFYYPRLALLPLTYFLYEIGGNVLLTIPFGWGIHWFRAIPARKIFFWAIGVGLATEGAQLLLDLITGTGWRTVDINDTLLNALGVLIGYGLYQLARWVYLRFRS